MLSQKGSQRMVVRPIHISSLTQNGFPFVNTECYQIDNQPVVGIFFIYFFAWSF